jgi:hypothetical protein
VLNTTLKNNFMSVVAAVSFAYASESVAAPPIKVVGTYDLNFFFSGALILGAHVEDDQGNPATDGVVVFQYCSLLGQPRNDITQPDEAPSSACADGSGHWVSLRPRISVDAEGDALLNFGFISVVNVIGFRYKYTHGSEVADAVTVPRTGSGEVVSLLTAAGRPLQICWRRVSVVGARRGFQHLLRSRLTRATRYGRPLGFAVPRGSRTLPPNARNSK